MTPKEKARELFDKFYLVCQEYREEIQCSIQAKKCAVNAIDEIIELPIYWIDAELQKSNIIYYPIQGTEEFWNEVKQEIEKL